MQIRNPGLYSDAGRRISVDPARSLYGRVELSVSSSLFKSQSDPGCGHRSRSLGVSLLTTLKEFEEALREQGMHMALAVLERLKERDRAKRTIRPARRVSGRKMTPELARRIIELNQTTDMTQQEIAFQLAVNQGRVNEVLKRGKWLTEDPQSDEAKARDKAKARMKRMNSEASPVTRKEPVVAKAEEGPKKPRPKPRNLAQLSIEDFLSGTSS